MRKWAAYCLAFIVAAGCSRGAPDPAQPPPSLPPPAQSAPIATAPLAPDPPSSPRPALQAGAWVDGAYVGPTLGFEIHPAPNGKWSAELAGERIGIHSLVVFAAGRGRAWVLEPNYSAYGETRLQWTDRNTLIFHRRFGPEERDTWFEADPASGQITPFLPEILTGRNGGRLRFSPDGRRLLVGTGYCDGCNKPSESAVTTYLVDLATGTARELGVDIVAEWDGDQVKWVAEPPHMGYSGPIFWSQNGLKRPLAESVQVGASDYVEWRAYRLDAKPGAPPFWTQPAVNRSGMYSSSDFWWAATYNPWDLWWPDPPAGPFRLELWAEVRPTVPDQPEPDMMYKLPELKREGGRRWAVVLSTEITPGPSDPPGQTVLLRSARMWDKVNGWGVGYGGRILRTVDGGVTWRDVSPAGFERCAGRYTPRQVERFAAGEAVVALACDRTGPDGKWTRESGRVSIFRSLDGGKTWLESSIEAEYRHAGAAGLQFLDTQNGFALIKPLAPDFNDLGALYRTADGGRTWQKVTDSASGLPAGIEVTFLNIRKGWAVGPKRDAIWLTEDGGRTWRQQGLELSDGTITGVWAPIFLSPTEGYLLANAIPAPEGARVGRRVLFWTQDGGQTWERRSEWDGERRPVFLTPAVGYRWEYELRSLNWTRDGGRTWENRVWDVNPAGMESVHFINEQTGFAVQGHLWVTADGAQSWAPVYPHTSQLPLP